MLYENDLVPSYETGKVGRGENESRIQPCMQLISFNKGENSLRASAGILTEILPIFPNFV